MKAIKRYPVARSSKRGEGCDSCYYFSLFTSKIQTAAKKHFHGLSAQGDWHWLNMDKKHGSGDSVEVQVSFGNWVNLMSQGELSVRYVLSDVLT